MSFEEFVGAVRRRVDELIALEALPTIEGPSFVWLDGVGRWRRRHQWATMSVSRETGLQNGYLLVLGRDPELTGPFGAQASPIPFAVDPDRVASIASTIAQHFSWPA